MKLPHAVSQITHTLQNDILQKESILFHFELINTNCFYELPWEGFHRLTTHTLEYCFCRLVSNLLSFRIVLSTGLDIWSWPPLSRLYRNLQWYCLSSLPGSVRFCPIHAHTHPLILSHQDFVTFICLLPITAISLDFEIQCRSFSLSSLKVYLLSPHLQHPDMLIEFIQFCTFKTIYTSDSIFPNFFVLHLRRN